MGAKKHEKLKGVVQQKGEAVTLIKCVDSLKRSVDLLKKFDKPTWMVYNSSLQSYINFINDIQFGRIPPSNWYCESWCLLKW